jgi:hypothetical protein
VLPEKLTGPQLDKKFPAFYGTPKVRYRLDGIIAVSVVDKLYFQKIVGHTFDTLYCVKLATLHVSAFPRPI